MADNYLITGYWGEPHVTAENDRGIHAGIIGAGRFVLPVGNQFRAEYIGNNTVRMYDGKLMDNGAAGGIPAGEYVDLLIANAGQGMVRHDLIVFQYSKDASTGVESGNFIIMQGTEVSSGAADPNLIQADLLAGDVNLDQMPLWRVVVSGTSIAAPVKVFTVSNNLAGTLKADDLGDVVRDEDLADWAKASKKPGYHANEISGLADYIVEQGTTQASYTGDAADAAIGGVWMYRKWDSGIAECWIKLSRQSAINKSWGSLYETLPFPAAVYPIAFAEMPMEFATGGNNASGGWVEVSGTALQTLTNTKTYQYVRPSKSDAVETLAINLYVVGKWK